MRFCTQCGAQLHEGDRFCWNCGAKVVPAVQPQAQPVSRPPAADQQALQQLFFQGVKCAKNKDYVRAAALYQQAAQGGHMGAKNNLGVLYLRGEGGFPQDSQKAFALFSAAAQGENAVAQRNVAECYLKGLGVSKDEEKAIFWFTKAGEQKDLTACHYLAKYYNTNPHRDSKKVWHWIQKGAECGDTGDQLRLADCLARSGDSQERQQAVRWYEEAAKSKTPQVLLRAAKGLNGESNGTSMSQPLDRERAIYWLTRAAESEDESVQLEAAKILRGGRDPYNGRERPPLDPAQAFLTHRQLATKGNRAAMLEYGYYYEIGEQVPLNLDLAITWYERAGGEEGVRRAQWCRQKKSRAEGGDDLDGLKPLYFPLEPVENSHLHGKEYYSNNVSFRKFYFQGRIYYLNRAQLCSSDEDGGNIQVLAEDEKFRYGSLVVNSTGIYIYEDKDHEALLIYHLTLEGEYCYQLSVAGNLPYFYFCDNKLFYVLREKGRVKSAYWLEMDSNTRHLIYEGAAQLSRIYGTNEKAILNMTFVRETEEDYIQRDGWYLYHLADQRWECITSQVCPPHYVCTCPQVFDEESEQYIPDEKRLEIVSFDLARDIMWTKRSQWDGPDSAHLRESFYLEARALCADTERPPLPNIQVWSWRPADNNLWARTVEQEYFDGICHYVVPHYTQFIACAPDGRQCHWEEQGNLHGKCEQFNILHSRLYLDWNAYGEKQYQATFEPTSPLRESWFEK